MKVSLNQLVNTLDSNAGVYRIYQKFTGLSYIGSSVTLRKRLNEHLRDLVSGRHHSIYLQRAWNKYGESSFDVEILEYCQSTECISREQYYLDLEKAYLRNYGYNMCSTAGSTLGLCYTTEQKAKLKLRKVRVGWKHRPETLTHLKKVRQTLNLEVIYNKISKTLMGRPNFSRMRSIRCTDTITNEELVFISIGQAAKVLRIPQPTISSRLCGGTKQPLIHQNLIFSYEN